MSQAARSVQDYWDSQLALLRELPRALEADEPDSLHDLRAAGRRSKATLRAFRPLLRRKLIGQVIPELDWFNSELGEPRDAEVIHEELAELFAGHPQAQPVLDDWAGRRDALRARAMEMVAGDRAALLMEKLDSLVTQPWRRSVRRSGKGPGTKQILVRADWAERRVGKAWRQVDDDPGGHTAGLHRVRRRAKAARYVYESVADCDSAATEKVDRYAQLSQLLGVVQDAVIVERALTPYPAELVEIALDQLHRKAAQAEEQVRAGDIFQWRRTRATFLT